MKKATQLFFLLFLAWSVFAQNGVIREISGTVELKPASAGAFVAAKNGDRIAQDTVVSTGFKSTALVEVGSSVIALRPLTRLTLSEISASAGAETLNVNLQAGRVRVDVNPPAGTRTSMTVTSPNATASVRGTRFDFDGRNLSTRTGVVDFKGSRDGVAKPVPASSTSGVTQAGKTANSTYVYTRPSRDSDGASGGNTTGGNGGFMVGTTTAGAAGGLGGAGDGLIPSGPVGSDPSSGSTPIGPAAPVAPPATPPPVITPPTRPPTTPPIRPPTTTPGAGDGTGVIDIDYS